MMNQKKTAWPVWFLCGIICVSILITIGIDFTNREVYGSTVGYANRASGSLVPIVFAVTAVLIMSRQPRNAIGWLLMIPAVAMAVGGPIESYFKITVKPTPAPHILLMAWFSGWYWLLLIIPFLHIPLLFPTGKPISPRWCWVSIAAILWAALFVLGASFLPSVGDTTGVSFPNPLGILPQEVFERWFKFWFPGLLVITVLCVSALLVRYRRATTIERAQIKWLLYACIVFAVNYFLGGVLNLGGAETFAGYLWSIIFGVSLMLVPVSITIAILRYRLWEIDFLIRRTLVYSILTVILGLVYFGGISLLQGIFSGITGEKSTAAIVISTLAIAALFNPLRLRLQVAIDRRFFRRKYDAEKTLAAFSVRLREDVDLDDLSVHLSTVVKDTFQPVHASIYLLRTSTQPVGANPKILS